MGLENRDYLRDSDYDPPVLQPPRSMSVVGWLISANVVVFLLQLFARSADGGFWLEDALVLTVDDAVFRLQFWRLLTYAFCHSRDSLFHIVFNMMTLHVASQLVLTVMREKELLWVYLSGAVFSGCVSLIFYSLVSPNASLRCCAHVPDPGGDPSSPAAVAADGSLPGPASVAADWLHCTGCDSAAQRWLARQQDSPYSSPGRSTVCLSVPIQQV